MYCCWIFGFIYVFVSSWRFPWCSSAVYHARLSCFGVGMEAIGSEAVMASASKSYSVRSLNTSCGQRQPRSHGLSMGTRLWLKGAGFGMCMITARSTPDSTLPYLASNGLPPSCFLWRCFVYWDCYFRVRLHKLSASGYDPVFEILRFTCAYQGRRWNLSKLGTALFIFFKFIFNNLVESYKRVNHPVSTMVSYVDPSFVFTLYQMMLSLIDCFQRQRYVVSH